MSKSSTMVKPKKVKSAPKDPMYLAWESFSPAGGTTLSQLTQLIDPYTHVDPILPSFSVGPLVPDLDLLGADINAHWELQGPQRFFKDEIEPAWTVYYLAAYIDLKENVTP